MITSFQRLQCSGTRKQQSLRPEKRNRGTPLGPTTRGEFHCNVRSTSNESRSGVLQCGSRDVECHFAGRERVCADEVERNQLDIVGLTSTHSVGSGTKLLERAWTLSYFGVAPGERRRTSGGLFARPRLNPVSDWVASLWL